MTQEQSIEHLTQIFKLMGHPIRLAIIQLLDHEGVMNVGQIVDALGYPQATISQQLAKLKAGDIVRGERQGTNVNYELIDPLVKKVITIL